MPKLGFFETIALKGTNEKLLEFMQSKEGGAFLDEMSAALKEKFGVDQEGNIADPEVKAGVDRFNSTLMADRDGVLLSKISTTLQQNPDASKNLTDFIRNSPDAARTLISRASQDPDALIEIAKKPGTGPAAKVASAAPETTKKLQGTDSSFDAHFQARTGMGDDLSLRTASPDSPASPASASSAAPAAAAAGGIAGMGGLGEMFAKLQDFFNNLPKIFEAIGQFFEQLMGGMKGNMQMAGNGGPNGPGQSLFAMAGGDPRKAEYQYGEAEPVAMYTPRPDAPAARMPGAEMDPALNPRLEPTQRA